MSRLLKVDTAAGPQRIDSPTGNSKSLVIRSWYGEEVYTGF